MNGNHVSFFSSIRRCLMHTDRMTFSTSLWTLLLLLLSPVVGAQTLVATIPLPAQPTASNFALPQEVAIDEDRNLVYATVGYRLDSGTGVVAVIDGSSDTLVGTIPVSYSPWGIGFNPGTGKLYVAHQGPGGVAVIDTLTATVVATINPSLRASGIAIDAANNLIYASQENSFNLWLIDGSTDSQLASFDVGVYRPSLLTLDAARNRLYISSNRSLVRCQVSLSN
jgi:YVTN family beta-propeller protein